ncbi:MAG TPA: putative molybdenum carrier protein [Alphaproteobacteria bacterium]
MRGGRRRGAGPAPDFRAPPGPRRAPARRRRRRPGAPLARLVSGGQAGVDRAALDAALAHGLACGGWCPRGRAAEDGPIDRRYPLRPTAGADPGERTRLNVRDSDGTLILLDGAWDDGTRFTWNIAAALGRPLLVMDLAAPEARSRALLRVLAWARRHRVATLNVAGPRESASPGIHARARDFLDRLLSGDPRGPA